MAQSKVAEMPSGEWRLDQLTGLHRLEKHRDDGITIEQQSLSPNDGNAKDILTSQLHLDAITIEPLVRKNP